ncbi:ras-related protein Rab-37-like [Stegodyphus dumicola]|uniref:ras-related protein Rab-37-like n=1 Tax=Stegodyphus dumicola TaxID=202533 RepID=UPI0015AC961D|nr:ras-related protein Rab-37-like [Stegodyphus dumicola]
MCDYLNRTFDARWIGRGEPTAWPPRSPDLSATGFFLWGTIKEHVYEISVDSGMDFVARIVAAKTVRDKPDVFEKFGGQCNGAVNSMFKDTNLDYFVSFSALLLLYDVTNKSSFDNTRAWLGEINEYAQDDVVIMLIGNKADATTDRQVMYEDGERLAKEYGVAFMETSAKTGINVELAFMAVARELKHRQSYQTNQESKFNVREYVRQESTKSSSTGTCCG